MTLSHQAAEALIKACDDPERNRHDLTKEEATEQIALIIAKVTGCDELSALWLKRLEALAAVAGYVIRGDRLIEATDALLSRLQPTNRNPDA